MNERESLGCRICGNKDGNTVFVVSEMQFGTREPFEYFQCSNCQTLQMVTFPQNMADYYPEEYSTNQPIIECEFSGLRGFFRLLPFRASLKPSWPIMWMISKIAPRQHSRCLNGLRLDGGARILDVGCGNGKHFLYPLRRMGFDCVGCDPLIADDIRCTNGLKVIRSEIAELDFGDGFDLITFHHSFEHIENPLDVLRCASGMLRAGGRIIIRMPTVSSFAWKRYGVNWVQLDAPRHLFLYSIEGLNCVAGLAGLRVARVRYDSCYFQFWGSENYERGIPLTDQRTGSRLRWWFKRWWMNMRARDLNRKQQGDQAVFYLEKDAER